MDSIYEYPSAIAKIDFRNPTPLTLELDVGQETLKSVFWLTFFLLF
jgi:hypothetical protein